MRSPLAIAILVFAFAFLSPKAGVAQDACTQPQAPAPVDGAQLSEEQMRAAMTAARTFIAQSDVYQACLANTVDAARTQAMADGKPLDPAVENDARAKMDANQKEKDKVGVAINTAVGVYKQTHLK